MNSETFFPSVTFNVYSMKFDESIVDIVRETLKDFRENIEELPAICQIQHSYFCTSYMAVL